MSDAVLHKQGSLDPHEWVQLRDHPVAGAAILDRLQMFRDSARFVRHHHERLDGKGYPDALAGTALPLGARILAVADAFDAMTSDRPYRRALPASSALARLREDAGTQFSPEIVEGLAATLATPAKLSTPADRARVEVVQALPSPGAVLQHGGS